MDHETQSLPEEILVEVVIEPKLSQQATLTNHGDEIMENQRLVLIGILRGYNVNV